MTTLKSRLIRTSSALMAFILVAALPVTVGAHALKETTARITLRDGQVEVRLWVDMNQWKARLQDNQLWLLGDIRQVMPTGLNPAQIRTFIKQVAINEITLSLNSQTQPLKFLFVSDSQNNSQHANYTELVFSSKHTLAVVEQIDIRFPKSLGTVHASFVKPKYQSFPSGKKIRVKF